MRSTILMFIAAVCLSLVAAYYSIVGLAAIFAGAFIPVVIMAGILEASKVITATWLYHNWRITPLLLKTYLTVAVVVLMLITSTGIFGFLSKAHIEQAAASADNTAKIERISSELDRLDAVIAAAQDKITALQSGTVGADATVQAQIDKEQARIDQAYARIQPAIDEQNQIIAQATGDNSQAKPYQDELAAIDSALKDLQTELASGNIKAAQAVIGVATDGKFGSQTQAKLDAYKAAQAQRRQELLNKIADLQSNAEAKNTISAAQAEIKRLRDQADVQVKPSQELIDKLRNQLGTVNTADVSSQLDKLNTKIKTAQDDKDTLSQQKYQLESDLRKLEVEVGPIKYLAQLIYGPDTNKDMLETAVRGMILLLIFVFDPLAVLMLIAANQGLVFYSKKLVSQQITEAMPDQKNEKPTNQAPLVSESSTKPTDYKSQQNVNRTNFVSRFAKLAAQIEPNTTNNENPIAVDPSRTGEQITQNSMSQISTDVPNQQPEPKTSDSHELSVDNADKMQNNNEDATDNQIDNTAINDRPNSSQIFGTRDFIDKLANAHAARLQKRSE